jgi:hypothetical protein
VAEAPDPTSERSLVGYAFLLPDCGAERVAFSGRVDALPELFRSSAGGNAGTACAECDTEASRRVVGVRGVLGSDRGVSLDGESFRSFEVSEVYVE